MINRTVNVSVLTRNRRSSPRVGFHCVDKCLLGRRHLTPAGIVEENQACVPTVIPHASHAAEAFGHLAISYEEQQASNSSGLKRRRSAGSFWAA